MARRTMANRTAARTHTKRRSGAARRKRNKANEEADMGKRIKATMDDLGTAFGGGESPATERTALDGYPAIADAVSVEDRTRALICVNCERTARGIIAGAGCEADGGEHVWTLESPADADIAADIRPLPLDAPLSPGYETRFTDKEGVYLLVRIGGA